MIREVYDAGDALVFRSWATQVRVPLTEIEEIYYTADTRPDRVTVKVARDTEFGRTLRFIPQSRLLRKKGRVLNELIVRIEIARWGAN